MQQHQQHTYAYADNNTSRLRPPGGLLALVCCWQHGHHTCTQNATYMVTCLRCGTIIPLTGMCAGRPGPPRVPRLCSTVNITPCHSDTQLQRLHSTCNLPRAWQLCRTTAGPTASVCSTLFGKEHFNLTDTLFRGILSSCPTTSECCCHVVKVGGGGQPLSLQVHKLALMMHICWSSTRRAWVDICLQTTSPKELSFLMSPSRSAKPQGPQAQGPHKLQLHNIWHVQLFLAPKFQGRLLWVV
jgi:hypothetical protein